MHVLRLAVVCIVVACAACGTEAAAGPGLDAFAEQVRAAVADAGNRHCARALPFETVDVVANQVHSFVAAAYGADPASTLVDNTACGTEGLIDCALAFNHDLYKSDGLTADALLPSARRVEAEATGVFVAVLTPIVEGLSRGPGIVIAGDREQTMFGIAFFNDLDACP